jgi:XTP/dITP diphosphohydrolase
MEIVIATSNEGKLKEFKELLRGLSLTIHSLKDFPHIAPVIEDGSSFYENALKKARTVARATGRVTMADDSGLEVDALQGKPGIYSSRFAGEGASDEANNAKLLSALSNLPPQKRGACFKCVLVVINPEGKSTFVEGECRGVIVDNPRGDLGFGYDPLFLVPEYKRTFSELEPEIKNKISHRARAVHKILTILPEYLSQNSISS